MSASPLVDNKIAEPRILSVFVASGLFYFSGAAALIYEVLWMKELSLLFGNSVQAAAATLAAFFTGIAAGNAYWGHRAAKLARPLLAYGYLELCVTLSAALYFVVYSGYDLVYPVLFNLFEITPKVFTLAKFILALLLFFPAAFFMGGTLPVMTQYLVRSHNTLGKRASLLYAINTFGAASGALAAGFYLPQKFGIDSSYLLAMAATLMVGLMAILLGRHHSHNLVNSGQIADQSTMVHRSGAKNSHNSVHKNTYKGTHKSKQDNAPLSPCTLVEMKTLLRIWAIFLF